jgi:hypothetical protein
MGFREDRDNRKWNKKDGGKKEGGSRRRKVVVVGIRRMVE